MNTFRWFKTCAVLLSLCPFFACRNSTESNDLRSAVATYDRLILKTDGDSIALLYAADGDLGSIAHGRDSIRKFLSRFKDFKVLDQLSTIDSLAIHQDTGYVSGTYRQRVIVPGQNKKDTVSIKGNFQSYWTRNNEYRWQIKKMETQPIK